MRERLWMWSALAPWQLVKRPQKRNLGNEMLQSLIQSMGWCWTFMFNLVAFLFDLVWFWLTFFWLAILSWLGLVYVVFCLDDFEQGCIDLSLLLFPISRQPRLFVKCCFLAIKMCDAKASIHYWMCHHGLPCLILFICIKTLKLHFIYPE